MYRNRNNNSNNYPRRNYNENRDYQNTDISNVKKHSKTMILLKSSVFALFIIFVTLLAAFVIIKNKKTDSTTPVQTNCEKFKTIKVNSEIDEIIDNGSQILVLTKSDAGKQDLIKIDAKCINELGRISFQQ